MAQLAVAAAGAAVGSLFGAPQVGWLVGSFIGSQLFAEKQQVEGPRLGDLQVQASTYGTGIPQVFGSMRLAGNVIWARPLIEKRRKQSAGKGGGGQSVVSYEYFANVARADRRLRPVPGDLGRCRHERRLDVQLDVLGGPGPRPVRRPGDPVVAGPLHHVTGLHPDRKRLRRPRVQGVRLPQRLRRDLPAHVGERRSGHRGRQQQPPADRLPRQHRDGARHLDRDAEHRHLALPRDRGDHQRCQRDHRSLAGRGEGHRPERVDTKQQSEAGVDRIRFQLNGLNQFSSPTIDDVYITDTATRLGESRVAVLYPSADTADADWTPSTGTDHYATVDETMVNSDADYVASGTVGDLDLYEIGDLPFVPDAIHAVQVTMCARKDDAATREVGSKVKSGAATANGAPHALTANYLYYRDIFETDPSTSTAWTSGGLNALQIGPEVVT